MTKIPTIEPTTLDLWAGVMDARTDAEAITRLRRVERDLADAAILLERVLSQLLPDTDPHLLIADALEGCDETHRELGGLRGRFQSGERGND